MKIFMSASSDSLDAQIDPGFGRRHYLAFVDSETMKFEAISNVVSKAMGGAGIQAVQTVANRVTKIAINGEIRPNAFQALLAAKIRIVTGALCTVWEGVERYKRGAEGN